MLVNNDYEILTPDGSFQFFDGIQISKHQVSLHLEFTDGSTLVCSEGHKLKLITGEFIEAEWIDDNCILHGNKRLKYKEYRKDEISLYDPINVGTKHEYVANKISHHNCEFQGSTGTLISGFVLKSMKWRKPEIDATVPGLSIYERPMEGRVYSLIADTAHGKGQDFSAFLVVDIAAVPYRVVAKYMNNTIPPVVFPSIIQKIGKYYNDAYVLIENNDIGSQILQSLFDDYEYDNLLSSIVIKKQLTLNWAVGNKKGERGVRTTRATKRIGCQLLKGMIESYKIKIEDFDIIMQLSTFINKGDTFQAEDGSHDDLVMCLVLFAWMSNQKFFADMCNTNIRRKLYEDQMAQIEDEMLPLPLPGNDSMENMFVSGGSVWTIVNPDDIVKY